MYMKEFALTKQYDYYVGHEQELLKKYNGTYLIITDDLMVFSFKDMEEAYIYGLKNFGAGNFLLQKCSPNELNVVHSVNWFL